MFLLDNPVQNYAWGSPTVIPELLGVPPSGEPQAELWAGAHPGAPSRVEIDGRTLDLAELIATDPAGMLGPGVRARFGDRLPYLLKILAIDRPLSIQAHPTIEQAEAGYAAEEAIGIPVNAPHRLYRDRSHKPEMIVALTAVEALVGFGDPADTAELLDSFGVSDLSGAARWLGADGAAALPGLARRGMLMPDAEAAELVGVVAEAATRAEAEIGRLVRWLDGEYPGDRGILLALLLKHERLQPGEAVFIPAGVPHAYLGGVAVEPQASSDNTLRAGLTPKHVDPDEILRVLRFEAGLDSRILPGWIDRQVSAYVPDVDEFVLYRVAPDGSPAAVPGAGPRIVLVTDGAVRASGPATGATDVGQGRAAFVPHSAGALTLDGDGTAFVISADTRRSPS
jgi:mannose-6-phosphate isomerase